jgi:hypothetical protein
MRTYLTLAVGFGYYVGLSQQACTLCSGGTYPFDDSARFKLGDDVLSCAQLYTLGPSYPDAECPAFQTIGTNICSCNKPLPTINNCSLCENSILVDPRRKVMGKTCSEIGVDAKRDDYENCQFYQATAGVYCGCDNPIAVASTSTCRLCSGATELTSSNLEIVVTEGLNETCGTLELQSNTLPVDGPGQSCEDYKFLFGSECCTPSPTPSPTLATSSAITHITFHGLTTLPTVFILVASLWG